jgi:flagellar basal-body rod protein FlgC
VNLFGMIDSSGQALQAERMRAEIVAANMANAETTRTGAGTPYRRQHVVFSAGAADAGFASQMGTAMGGFSGLAPVTPGVHVSGVVQDTSPALKRYDPGHPDADSEGYVSYPDINPLTEMVDLMGATRAYGLNSSAIQAEKSMIASALEIAK